MSNKKISIISRVVRDLMTEKQELSKNGNNNFLNKWLRIIKYKIIDYFLEKIIDSICLLCKIDSNPFELFQNIPNTIFDYLISLLHIKSILLQLIDLLNHLVN